MFSGSRSANVLQALVIISYVAFETWSSLHSRPSNGNGHENTSQGMLMLQLIDLQNIIMLFVLVSAVHLLPT